MTVLTYLIILGSPALLVGSFFALAAGITLFFEVLAALGVRVA